MNWGNAKQIGAYQKNRGCIKTNQLPTECPGMEGYLRQRYTTCSNSPATDTFNGISSPRHTGDRLDIDSTRSREGKGSVRNVSMDRRFTETNRERSVPNPTSTRVNLSL